MQTYNSNLKYEHRNPHDITILRQQPSPHVGQGLTSTQKVQAHWSKVYVRCLGTSLRHNLQSTTACSEATGTNPPAVLMEYLLELAMDSMLEHLEHILVVDIRRRFTGRTSVTDVSHFLNNGRAVTDLAAVGKVLWVGTVLRAVVDDDRRLLNVAMDTKFFKLGMTKSR